MVCKGGERLSYTVPGFALLLSATAEFCFPVSRPLTVNPPMIYGPALQSFGSEEGINTSSANIWSLISGKTKILPDNRLPLFCDSRDVSKAHLLALEKPEAKGHRFPIYGGAFTWEEVSPSHVSSMFLTILIHEAEDDYFDSQAADFIRKERPELADRLPQANPDAVPIEHMAKIDTSVARNVLGMNEFIDWKTCLLDTIDDLLAKQKNNWQ